MKKVLGVITMVALSATVVSAELVGSLHIDVNQDFTNEVSWTGFETRTTNGAGVTRGTVAGDFSFLGGSVASNYTTVPDDLPDLKTFSDTTKLINIDRYGGFVTRAVVVWDFDLSGIETNAWDLNVVFADRGIVDKDEWFISFNGLGRTLDTTDVTSLEPGTGHLITSDPNHYIKVGELPAGSDESGTYRWNLTPIIEAAQSNDSLVRLVYVAAGFYEDITFTNDTGLIATDISSGQDVEIPKFFVQDDFETGTGTIISNVLVNGWNKTGGPEAVEYNEASSGILDIRDELVFFDDGDTNLYHVGSFDGVQFQFEGVKLSDVGDWLELSADIGCYESDSGAHIFDSKNPMANLTLVDSSKTEDAGYGFYIRRRMAQYSKLNVFDSALGWPQTDVSGGQSTRERPNTNGVLQTWTLRIERIEGDNFSLTPTFNGKLFGPNNNQLIAVTNNECIDAVFDTVTFHVRGNDIGMNIDNVTLISNVELTPYEAWLQLYGLSDTNALYSADPDGDLYNNMYEWGLGGDPTNELDQGIPPVYSADGTVFTYTYPSNLAAGDLSYYLETRDDLSVGSWSNTGYVVTGAGLHSEDNAFAAVTNDLSMVGKDEQFIKLIIEEVP